MIRAILFDLDNTLADRVTAHRRFCEDFARRYLSEEPMAIRLETVEEMVRRDDFGYADRTDYFNWLAARFPQVGQTCETIWDDYCGRLVDFLQPLAGVWELITRLDSQFQLAVVTNGSSANQRAKLSRIELADLIPHVVISGECGFEKPSAEIFRLALSAVDCAPRETLFVGDDPCRDIQAAADVGMQTCWISLGRTFPSEFRPPDRVIGSLSDWEGP